MPAKTTATVTVKELKQKCRDKGIPGFSKMRKSDLLGVCMLNGTHRRALVRFHSEYQLLLA